MLRKPLLRVMTALFAVLIMLAGALVPMSTTPASAADVTAWVELSSTKPGPGCTIAMAIEIRSAGRAISGAEVSIALFDNGSVIGIDTEYTNDNGVAYLGVNAASGADWMDLNIGGSYMKGYSIAVTSGNGCESSPKVETLSGNLNTGLGAASYPPYYIYGQMRRLRANTHRSPSRRRALSLNTRSRKSFRAPRIRTSAIAATSTASGEYHRLRRVCRAAREGSR
ncbi:MAG: hypothetical protein R2845_16085 [Thermomicrobiales bacterium]